MRRTWIILLAALTACLIVGGEAWAETGRYRDPAQRAEPEYKRPAHRQKVGFPYIGWHTGPYVAANIGFMTVKNDRNEAVGRNFDGGINPAFGLTFGYDFLDWLGPMLQFNYSTNSDTVGNGSANFPNQKGREHIFDILALLRFTFFTHSEMQPDTFKVMPYMKIGGMAQILFIDAPAVNNKFGTGGGGMAFGGGVEFSIWRGIFIALDITENLFWQKSFHRNIGGVQMKTLDGGFKTHFTLMGLFGWHF